MAVTVTPEMRTQVSQLYVALFGRAPDSEGLGYWVQQVANGASIATVADAMYGTTPARTYYPLYLTPEEIVTKFYQNVLGRNPDTDGKTYWTGELQKTDATPGSVIAKMISVVANYDTTQTSTDPVVQAGIASAKLFNNKVAVAEYFATKVGTVAGSTDVLATVTADPATVTAAKAVVDGVGVPGQTFTLTTSPDNIVGTAGNDTIVGTKTTFQAADSIDGGAGTDKLQLTIDGAVTAAYDLPAADVKNVEIISVRNVQTGTDSAATKFVNVNGNNFVGATEFVNDRSDQGVAFNNIGKADVTIQGNGVVTHAATNIKVGASAVTDAFVLNIKDGVKGGDVTVDDTNADWTAATINSTGAANTVGNLNLSGTTASSTHTIKTLTINAATNLTTGNITGFDTGATVTNTIKVAGAAAKVDIGTVAGAIDVIDASGLTAGGLTANISGVGLNAADQAKFKLTGGAGNDTITTSSDLALTKAGGGVVDAGAGDADVLAVAAAFAAGTAAHKEAAALYKNFEVLQVNAGVDQDVSLFSGSTIGAIRINAAAATGATGVSNLSAAQAANITLMGAASTEDISIGVKDATVTGNLDTVKITVDGLVSGNAAQTVTVGAGKLKMAGVENLEITAVDNFTLDDLVNASDVQHLTLKGAGNFDITTGAVNLAINSSIDATAATGTVKIDASGAQAGSAAKGLAIKGSLANTNDIKDSAKADVITGGDKADLVTFTGGKDVVTLGKGNDVFDFNSVTGTDNEVIFKFVAGDSVGKAGATTIADLLTGNTVDQIKGIASNANAASTEGQKFTIDTDVSATAVKSASSIVFGTTTVDNAGDFFVLIGATGVANTTAYVFQDSDGNGKIDASDFAVELVGVANAFAASEFSVAGGNLVYTSAV